MSKTRALTLLALGLPLGAVAGDALAQRVVAKPKDAPAQSQDDSTDDDDTIPAPAPSTPSTAPAAAPTKARSGTEASTATPPPKPKAATAAPKPKALPDGGVYVKPTLKDDLTADEIKRNQQAPAAVSCAQNPCERLTRKRNAKRELLMRLRPSQPQLGEVAEVIVEASEVLEESDPEMGDKKPMENLTLTGHLEGVGKFALVPVAGTAGAYGFHFTPQVKGLRKLTIEGAGSSEDFDLPIAVAAPTDGSEVRLYDPRPGLDEVGQNMADLGAAWGSLWAISQKTGKGDAAALAKVVVRLADAGRKLTPSTVSGNKVKLYTDQAGAFADAAAKALAPVAAGSGDLKGAMHTLEEGQCYRCHGDFVWGLAAKEEGE